MPRERGAPPQIDPKSLGDYLEVMSKAVFQSGISWDVVENKWPGLRQAFRGFDAEAVAQMSERDIDRLATDTRVIRNRRKIEAIIENANRLMELDARHTGFRNYLRSFGSYDALAQDLRKHFRFLGETGCYFFVYVVGEQVPPYEEWHAARSGR